MSTSRKILRWIFFIPAGILASFLVMFPIHWFVMINLGGWGIDPVIEIRNPETLRNIEMILQTVFGPLSFTYFAARVAPSYRRTISILLGCVIVVGLPLHAHFWNANTVSNGSGFIINHGFGCIIANVLGVGGAIFLIHLYLNKESNEK